MTPNNKGLLKKSNLMMQSPTQSPLQSRAGSLLTLAPKLSALMQTGMQHQAPSSAISG